MRDEDREGRVSRGLRPCEGRRARIEWRIKGRFGPTENPDEESWRTPLAPRARAGDAILPSFPSSERRNRGNATYGWLRRTNERAIGQGRASSVASRSLSSQLFTERKWAPIKPRHFPINTLIKSSHRLFVDNRLRARLASTRSGNGGSQAVANARPRRRLQRARKYAAPTFRHLIRNCVLTSRNCLPRC